ncbi:hypothetical protein MG290_02180 [Flavobacterium sp. CBA20B-1]|uniref:hypothetical protein n=1 Tax=unclassified Flavobacterium TaxID=196869 RepID=UPI002224982E|nr:MULTISPECIES: hypothetical protein [unclassified Flavobacterium]WCM42501.1 hypothetical protein MG290_02180 [Flavobacterium sp. CBA20B-1]
MKSNFLSFLLFICCISCEKKQNISDKEKLDSVNISFQEKIISYDPYDFDTLLSDGYYLSYKIYEDTIENQKLQSLTLKRDTFKIKELNVIDYPLLHKNLGYIGADFGKSFLFVQSFGSGNPHQIELIEKKTGKSLTKGIFVDCHEDEKVLLYITSENQNNEKLILLDIKNNQKKNITDFNNLNCSHIGRLRNCVEIDTVTNQKIILKTNSESDSIIRYYNR